MKKKSYNRNYEYFKSNQVGMIKRLIETYLQNEKIASLSRSELEQQRNVIFSFLKHNLSIVIAILREKAFLYYKPGNVRKLYFH